MSGTEAPSLGGGDWKPTRVATAHQARCESWSIRQRISRPQLDSVIGRNPLWAWLGGSLVVQMQAAQAATMGVDVDNIASCSGIGDGKSMETEGTGMLQHGRGAQRYSTGLLEGKRPGPSCC